ncbi:DUF6766 family protein [Pedobacter panaciterrae]
MGPLLRLYQHSLSVVLIILFLFSWEIHLYGNYLNTN